MCIRDRNEIERPEDLRVRTVANKSKMKVAIIQAIDRKVALDDIAMSKGISPPSELNVIWKGIGRKRD